MNNEKPLSEKVIKVFDMDWIVEWRFVKEAVEKLKDKLKDMLYYRKENGTKVDICLEEIDKIFGNFGEDLK